jgi:hypothetical protein
MPMSGSLPWQPGCDRSKSGEFYQMPLHLRQTLADAVSKRHKNKKIIIILCVKF